MVVADDATPPQATDVAVSVFVAPSPISWFAAITTQMVASGQSVTLDLSQFTTDPNTPPLPISFALVGGPVGAAMNSTTGLFTWATPSDQPAGPVTITFQAFDAINAANPARLMSGNWWRWRGGGPGGPPHCPKSRPSPLGLTSMPTGSHQKADMSHPAQASFTMNFLVPPAVEPIPTQDVLDVSGEPYSLNLGSYASDPNLPPLTLTYSLAGDPPAGMSIDPSSGLLTWVVPAGQPAGMTVITVNISDDQSPPDTTSAVVTVDLLLPPVIQPIPTQDGLDINGDPFIIDVGDSASDPNLPPLLLTYSLAGNPPAGASIDPRSGVLTWIVPAGQPAGMTAITVDVSDDQSPLATTSAVVTFDLTDPITGYQAPPPLPPVTVTASPAVQVDVGHSMSVPLSGLAHQPVQARS